MRRCREKFIISCLECDKTFNIPKCRLIRGTKFCSANCYGNWSTKNMVGENAAHWQGKTGIIICPFCKVQFIGNKSRIYCSNQCVNKDKHKFINELSANWRGGQIIKSCKHCKSDFSVYQYRRHTAYFCTKICEILWRKINQKEYRKNTQQSIEYREWRTAVFKRDSYMCVWCKIKGKQLNADHIKPFSLFPDLRFNIDNGRTLCVDCHKKTDTYAGKLQTYRKHLGEICQI